ncbi:protein rolling stone-like [Lytechinus variegatus]|uniref:protein rolling stone-like n=1 Tax=Lytechinus variegatus TaxID=7654 RepID=UPI001BB204F4|nr:protein rolling stone-like [Lytechinus variegatus]
MCDSETCSSCDFDTRYPSNIVRPVCDTYAKLSFVVYRLLIVTYLIVFLVIHLSTSIAGVSGLKVFIYLSDWNLVLTTLYLIVAFLNAVADYAYYQWYGMYFGSYHNEPPVLYRLQWCLFSICIIISLLIAVSFWPTVGYDLPTYKLAENINIHAVPGIIMVIDLMVTAIPIRFFHVIYPLFVGGIYLAFAAIYWAAGGTDPYGHPYIYRLLDFSHPRIVGLVVVGETVGAVVFQWLLAGLKLLRNKVAYDCNCAPRVRSVEVIPLTEVATVASYS